MRGLMKLWRKPLKDVDIRYRRLNAEGRTYMNNTILQEDGDRDADITFLCEYLTSLSYIL